MRFVISAVCGFLVMAIPACDRYPADQRETLSRIDSTQTLRVGITDEPPWVQVETGGEPAGIEPDLLRRFAKQLDVDIVWERSASHTLFERLQRTDLDVVIGGFTKNDPWKSRVGFTRPYYSHECGSSTIQHVMAVPQGENALLMELERMLRSVDEQAIDAELHGWEGEP